MLIKNSIFILCTAIGLLYFQTILANPLSSNFELNGIGNENSDTQANASRSFQCRQQVDQTKSISLAPTDLPSDIDISPPTVGANQSYLTRSEQQNPQVLNAESKPYWQGALGPLTIRSLSPVQSLRLAPIPRAPYGLPKGQTEIQFNMAVANIFISTWEFTMDYEFTDTRVAINHGFANNWSAEISFNERRIVSAHLDQLRSNFHDLLGLEDRKETEASKNNTRIYVPALGIDLGNEIRGKYSQNIGLSIQNILNNGAAIWPAIAMNINISYETHNSGLIELGELDYGIQFSVAKKQANGYAYGNISFTHLSSDESLGLQLQQQQFTGMLGYEFTVRADQAFILQYLFSEGGVKNLSADELDDYSHEIHFGYKWRTKSYLWEMGIVENLVNSNNSPDFAFTLGLTYKL